MSKRLVYTRPEDGGVSVVHVADSTRMMIPRPGFPPMLEPEPYWLQRIAAHVVPPTAQDVHVVDVKDIPTDRSFRNAWSHKAGVISVHMDKARDIHRGKLRAARQPMLQQLDVEYQRAHERGDEEHMKTVAVAKQVLRDVTQHPDIDAAQTPNELKAIWPFPDAPSNVVQAFVPTTPVQMSDELEDVRTAPIQTAELQQQAGHQSGWVGKLVGNIDESDTLQITPAPLPLAEPDPVEPYHLPPVPEPPPLDDAARRRAAKAHIRRAAHEFAFTENDRVLYEHALMAHNGNVSAMEIIKPMAQANGLTVAAMADRIITENTTKARRMSYVNAIQTTALAALDQATGDQIDALEQDAVAKIRGDL